MPTFLLEAYDPHRNRWVSCSSFPNRVRALQTEAEAQAFLDEVGRESLAPLRLMAKFYLAPCKQTKEDQRTKKYTLEYWSLRTKAWEPTKAQLGALADCKSDGEASLFLSKNKFLGVDYRVRVVGENIFYVIV